MKKRVTLKTIAKELDVSISTVSKALRDSDEISKDTREKVQAFAKLYNYKPNSIALNLRNQSTHTIAIIIPQITNEFFAKVIKGIEQEARKKKYNTIIVVSNDSFEQEILNINTLFNNNIDGVIISIAKETMFKRNYDHLTKILNQGIPVVMFDRFVEQLACDKVIIDDAKGTEKAIRALLNSGCTKPALITTEDYISVGRLRKQGYINTLLQAGLTKTLIDSLIITIPNAVTSTDLMDYIAQKIDSLLKIHPDIDALIGVNEIYTICALNYLKFKNIHVPNSISVITFSDGDLPKYAYPSITAISQNGVKMGTTAAQLLIDRIRENSSSHTNKTLVIETELIKRQSTKLNL